MITRWIYSIMSSHLMHKQDSGCRSHPIDTRKTKNRVFIVEIIEPSELPSFPYPHCSIHPEGDDVLFQLVKSCSKNRPNVSR